MALGAEDLLVNFNVANFNIWCFILSLKDHVVQINCNQNLSQILDKRMHENELIYLRRARTSFLVSDD